MKKLIILISLACLVFAAHPGFAARGGKRGADQKAYEHASGNAMFNRVGDWFATRGKSREQKKAMIEERKIRRAEIRAMKKREEEAKKEQKRLRKTERKTEKIQKRLRLVVEQVMVGR